jgi:hypothetical protein
MIPILVGLSVLVLLAFVCIAVAVRQRRSLADKFPPISDAEFLARCTPGTSPEVALKVRRILANSLGVDYKRIHPSMRFVEDIAAD